ncbi:hypothetical protein IE077_003953 [Cardiosporidium cionae]|uniref:Ribosomal RNA small subunit methyltransferase NEP1 n=1 Tax=Cardiosporidium cionae TaxID=476202 RepID=A0ABQ7JEF2_9APIC|nr:hypothetical protein IE077_003953 [Cardiosporidium cionae]|eukprot:KAF8822348.1 hypothetical protein IE077_003953 [Cardiosporidium cionae]
MAVSIILTDASLCVQREKNGVAYLMDADRYEQNLVTARQANKRAKSENSKENYRSDILHQCLLSLLDSPLNKAKKLSIFLVTNDKKVVKVSSLFRIPRTWKLFSKVMTDFLTSSDGCLLAEDAEEPLLELLEPPLSRHLNETSRKILLTPDGNPVELRKFVSSTQHEKLDFFIGASSLENATATSLEIPFDYSISISNFILTASVCCSRLTHELELAFNVY